MKCILHIGIAKTGSTAIQSALSAYDDGKTFYAQLGHDNHSVAVHTVFSENFLSYHDWVKRGLSDVEIRNKRKDFKAKLEEQLGTQSRETILISGEGIGLLQKAEIVEFIEFLNRYCEDITVLAYVRHPLDFAASAFQQKVQGGLNAVPDSMPSFTRYRLEKFAEILGKDNVIVRKYAPDFLMDGDIVKDFCAALNLNFDLAAAPQANESLGCNALKCLYMLNRSNPLQFGDPVLYRSRNELIRALKRIFGNDAKPDKRFFTGLADNRDSAWLKQTFDIDFTVAADTAAPNKDLAEWLYELPRDAIDALTGFLKVNDIETDFERDPTKIINRTYYLILEGRRLSPDGLKLVPGLLEDADADFLRDIALKHEQDGGLSRFESLQLMKLAHRARPYGQLIQDKISEWSAGKTKAPRRRPLPPLRKFFKPD